MSEFGLDQFYFPDTEFGRACSRLAEMYAEADTDTRLKLRRAYLGGMSAAFLSELSSERIANAPEESVVRERTREYMRTLQVASPQISALGLLRQGHVFLAQCYRELSEVDPEYIEVCTIVENIGRLVEKPTYVDEDFAQDVLDMADL